MHLDLGSDLAAGARIYVVRRGEHCVRGPVPGCVEACDGTDGHRPHVVFHEMARARSLPGGLELWPLREGTLREEVDDLVLTFDGDAAGIVVEQAARSHNFALIAPLPWPRERWGSPLEVWHL